MKFEQMDIPFKEKENKQENIVLNKYEINLSSEEESIVKHFLGAPEDIYSRIEASLDALNNKRAGSPEIGSSAFYNSIIMSSVSVTTADFKLCRKVINAFIKKIQNDEKMEAENLADLDQLVDLHLNAKPVDKNLREKALEDKKIEEERAGIDPEEYNNL